MAASLLSAMMLAATVASAQDDAKTEAKAHFEAGLVLFKAEKYEAAALELEASVKLYPNKGGFFNLASVYKVLSRYDDALDALDRLEKDYAKSLDEEMRSAAEKMRSEITKLAARIEVTVEPAGAVVTVDGREVGKSPLARPVLVDPGEHVVEASRDGYAASRETVRLISRQTAKVGLSLERRKGAQAAPAQESPSAAPVEEGPVEAGEEEPVEAGDEDEVETDRKKLSPGWFWGGLGATVAFGAVTLGMELAVRSNKDNIANEGELEKNEGMQKAGIVFMGLTAAAAVTTAVLAGFTRFEKKGGEEEAKVEVGFAPSGVALAGRF